MTIIDKFCCFPRCEMPPSTTLDEPLCDQHLMRIYRSVIALSESIDPKAITVPGVPRRFVRVSDKRSLNRKHSIAGKVYFIRFGDRIKIGFTTDLQQRTKHVPTDELLASMPGSYRTEHSLHSKFAHLRINGEWFSMGTDLMEYIESLKQTA